MSRPSISGFLRENENEARIQQVMQQEGVSIQVARNLLKGRSLGVGPGNKDKLEQSAPGRAGIDPGGALPGPPPKMDKKAAERAMALKLKKLQEEEEEREDLEQKKKKAELLRKRSQGVIRLGPVSAREEQVDPLKIKVAAEQARREEEARRQEELREMQERQQMVQQQQGSAGSSAEPRSKHAADAARRFVEEEPGRKKKRARAAEGDDSDEERVAPQKKGRAPSPVPDERKAASSSGDGLMTEAEARALVKKNKTSEIQRGTGKAKERIQREMQEWEQSKAKNPEFWKPPKFCLVLGSGRR